MMERDLKWKCRVLRVHLCLCVSVFLSVPVCVCANACVHCLHDNLMELGQNSPANRLAADGRSRSSGKHKYKS